MERSGAHLVVMHLAQRQEMIQSAEEVGEELARQRDEERRHNEKHLKASQTTAEHLHAVTHGLNEVTESLQGVHTRLDRQKADSANENKRNRGVAWLAAIAVVATLLVSTLLHFL